VGEQAVVTESSQPLFERRVIGGEKRSRTRHIAATTRRTSRDPAASLPFASIMSRMNMRWKVQEMRLD
jgi:hypothetical protein